MSLFKSASVVSLLTLASRVTGLVRETLIASMFGASAMTDAFNVAFRIPNMFRRFFAEGAFSQAFVPVLAGERARHGDEQTKAVIDHVATALAWVLVLTCVIGVMGAPVLVWILASGLQKDPASFQASVVMTRWMFPYIGFMSLVALAAGVLNTWKRFAVPAATPVLLNLAMILAAWQGAPWLGERGVQPIYALAGGVIAGGVLQLSVQMLALRRLRLMPSIGWRWAHIRQAWDDPATRRVATLMLPALLGVSVAHISTVINTQIASHLSAGSVSWLTYADRLMEFPTALLGVALGVVLTPQLSAARAQGDMAAYSSLLDWGLRLVLLLALPCAVALLVFPQALVAVLYHYGAITPRDVERTSVALMGYGVGLMGLIGVKILAPGFYARQDIRTPVRIAIVVLALTQAMNLVFVPLLGHAGLALSIGLGALVNAAWLFVGLRRKGLYTPEPGWALFALRVLLACALMGALLWWASHAIDWIGLRAQPWARIGLLAACIAAAVAAYFATLLASGLNLRQFRRRG